MINELLKIIFELRSLHKVTQKNGFWNKLGVVELLVLQTYLHTPQTLFYSLDKCNKNLGAKFRDKFQTMTMQIITSYQAINLAQII